MTSTFSTAPAALPRVGPLDPTKHVNYTLGMVLGVDDFTQEFTYLSGRDRWLARDAIGYGTLWGLGVSMDVADKGPRITVAPGVALTPCGQLVCVSPAQCADVNDWLAANEQAVRAELAEASATSLTLYAVLCYSECQTDDVPIPGEPCRDESSMKAPSRVKDDFRLELRLERPPQLEDDSVVDFVTWLREIEVVDGDGTPLNVFLDAIRSAATTAEAWLDSPPHTGSPPELAAPEGPFDFLYGSPPGDLAIPHAHLRRYLDAAFRLWTTELRPHLRHGTPGCECGCGGGCGCDGGAQTADDPCEDAVLLAELNVPLVFPGGGIEVADTGWFADDGKRPYVVNLRLLQEWILSGSDATWLWGSPPAGPAGPSGLSILSTSAETVPAGDPASATLNSTTGELHFRIPAGPAGVDTASAEGLPAGSPPTVAFNAATRNLHFAIPAGAEGTSVKSASATTVSNEQPAAVSFDGESGNLAFEIPAGPTGAGVVSASAETVSPGTAAAATFDSGTGDVHFRIPAGAPGTSVTSVIAQTLPPGTAATAAFDEAIGQLVLGIPQGPQGEAGAGGIPIIAAGQFGPGGQPQFALGGLRATLLPQANLVPPTPGVYHLAFDKFTAGRFYLVTGVPLAVLPVGTRTFELLPPDATGIPAGCAEGFAARGLRPNSGLVVRITGPDPSSGKFGFQVQIADITGVIG